MTNKSLKKSKFWKIFFVLAGRGSRVLKVDLLNVITVAYSSSQFSESHRPAHGTFFFEKNSVLAEWCVFYQIVRILLIFTDLYYRWRMSFHYYWHIYRSYILPLQTLYFYWPWNWKSMSSGTAIWGEGGLSTERLPTGNPSGLKPPRGGLYV